MFKVLSSIRHRSGFPRRAVSQLNFSSEPVSENIVWSKGLVSKEDRATVLGQKGGTVWLTGLSGSGKSAIASVVERKLLDRGIVTYRLDGDNLRFGLNRDLGFSPEDRDENIRRVGEVAKILSDAGVVVLTAFISPYAEAREKAAVSHEESGLEFLEVYVQCSLEGVAARDPKVRTHAALSASPFASSMNRISILLTA